MTDRLYEEAITHFGVRGMHWGVRKDNGGSSGSSGVERAKGHAKAIGKAAGPAIVKAGLVAGLVSIGAPAIVAGGTAAALVAANPELVAAGRDYAELILDKTGIHDLSTPDVIKKTINVKRAQIKLNNSDPVVTKTRTYR